MSSRHGASIARAPGELYCDPGLEATDLAASDDSGPRRLASHARDATKPAAGLAVAEQAEQAEPGSGASNHTHQSGRI